MVREIKAPPAKSLANTKRFVAYEDKETGMHHLQDKKWTQRKKLLE